MDIAMVMEPNKVLVSKGNWIADKKEDAAIKILNKSIKITSVHRGGVVYVRL